MFIYLKLNLNETILILLKITHNLTKYPVNNRKKILRVFNINRAVQFT